MAESQQKIRDRILNQIPETINDFLRAANSTPIRILSDTPNSVLDHETLSTVHTPVCIQSRRIPA